jgi:hypothetical protein
MRMIRTTNVIQSTGNFWVELICREHVVPPHLIRNQKDVASVLSLLLLGKLVSGATRSTVGSRSPPGSSSSTGRPRRIFSPHSFTFIHCWSGVTSPCVALLCCLLHIARTCSSRVGNVCGGGGWNARCARAADGNGTGTGFADRVGRVAVEVEKPQCRRRPRTICTPRVGKEPFSLSLDSCLLRSRCWARPSRVSTLRTRQKALYLCSGPG